MGAHSEVQVVLLGPLHRDPSYSWVRAELTLNSQDHMLLWLRLAPAACQGVPETDSQSLAPHTLSALF